MKTRLGSFRKTLLLALAIGLGSWAWLYRFANKDPDLHHDGFMVAAAIGMHDGLILHRDIFQAYGLPVTVLQSLLSPDGGPTVLSLRLLSITMSALTAALLVLTAQTGIPLTITSLSALAWVVLADFSWTSVAADSVRPMSAVLAVLLLVGCYLCVALSVQGLGTTTGGLTYSLGFVFLSGILLSMLFFSRLNLAVPSLIAGALIITRVSYLQLRNVVLLLASLCIGLGTGSLPILAYLAHHSATDEYWDDAVLFPRRTHIPFIWENYVVPFQNNSRSLLLVGFFVGVVSLGSLIYSQRKTTFVRQLLRFKRSWLALILVALAVGGALYAISKGAKLGDPYFSHLVLRFIFWLFFGCTLCIVLLLGTLRVLPALIRFRPNRFIAGSLTTNSYILVIYSAISLVLVVPWLGPRYVWWALPLPILTVFWTLLRRSVNTKYWERGLMAAIGAFALVGAHASSPLFQEDRTFAPPNSILRGMLLSKSQAQEISRRLEAMRLHLPAPAKYTFICWDSFYTSPFGSYRASNKFLHWNPYEWGSDAPVFFDSDEARGALEQETSDRAHDVILCATPQSPWWSKLKARGFKPVYVEDGFTIWRKPSNHEVFTRG